MLYEWRRTRRRHWYVPRPRPGARGEEEAPAAPVPPRGAPAEERPEAPAARPDVDVYHHFQTGVELLESGNPAQAAVRLEKAKTGAPHKTSIREALGRAYFAVGRWQDAEREFRAVIEAAPTNDYAHYALGRSLQRQGRHEDARTHLKLARAMRSDESSAPGGPRLTG